MSEPVQISPADYAATLELRLAAVTEQRNQAMDAAALSKAAATAQKRHCDDLGKQLSEATGRITELETELATRPPAPEPV
jgi:chromosome segregation ATPase